ncbi:tumor necrosis factor receptor superfamily member 14-like isoform X2 [Poecilia latipinna]|uniref:tumor necrosis factor receptor superfamily member 14-like isoform X2 n=1 Tax=Poecilia latipinna TaxID=48699 RepID=UPI00072E85F6|nr:PREDICTED: tumor necrosis factor receptor superfamily member 14-like isoform X2 [Poecilia latipinna]
MICWVTKSMLLMTLMRDFRVDSITCHLTEYEIEGECCPMCPPGTRVKTDCTEFKSTSCQKCPERTYMDLPNRLKRCYPCSTCGSGAGLKEKRGCEITADTVCEPMEGFYCTDSTSEGCVVAQKHRSCEPGQFISRMGTASTDTECSECISGSFSDGTMLSCQNHTQCEKENLQLIKAGTASTDAECGEKSSNITGIVIGVLVVFLVAATIGGVFLWKYHKNTKSIVQKVLTVVEANQRRDSTGGAEEEVAFNMPVQETPR